MAQSNRSAYPQANSGSQLQQPWLGVVRVAWPVAAVVHFGVLILSLPGYLFQPDGTRIADAPTSMLVALDVVGGAASLVAALSSLGLATLLYWRKPRDKMSVYISVFLLAYGIVMAGPMERLPMAVPPLGAINMVVFQQIFFATPFIALFGIFPDGRFVPGWMRWVTLASVAMVPTAFIAPCCAVPEAGWASLTWAPWVLWFVLIGLGIYAQVYRFRRVSSRRERQQTRWVVIGLLLMMGWFTVSSVPFAMTQSLPPGAPQPWWSPVMGALWWLSLIILPASLTLAVLRFRLFDLDLIIQRTLLYGVLTALLALVYLGSVIGLQRVFALAGGGQSTAAIVLSTLLIAALFAPLRQRVKAAIDRRFYRSAYDAQQVLAAFGRQARDEVDLEAITEALLRAVHETLQPEHAALWRSGQPVMPARSAEREVARPRQAPH